MLVVQAADEDFSYIWLGGSQSRSGKYLKRLLEVPTVLISQSLVEEFSLGQIDLKTEQIEFNYLLQLDVMRSRFSDIDYTMLGIQLILEFVDIVIH